MPEVDPIEVFAKKRAAQDMKLTSLFQFHGLGRAGIPQENGGGIITAFNVIDSFRLRDVHEMKESLNDALIRFLKASEVPVEVAAEIGILWGARYGSGEDEIAIIGKHVS